jgi:hypothetical protein
MNEYKVTVPAAQLEGSPPWVKSYVIVKADYFRLEGGHLVFRDNSRCGSYPETHRAFAPGMWSEVILCR